MCMSICACSHVWVWACAWLIIAHVEVRGQPWVLDLAFSPFVCSCVLQASWVWCAPLSPSSILLYPVLGYRFVLLSPVLHGFWGSKSRVLTLSPSSHFSRPQCYFYWLKKEIMSAGCHSFWKLCWRILLLHLCMCVYSCVNCCGGQRSSSGSCLWRLLPTFVLKQGNSTETWEQVKLAKEPQGPSSLYPALALGWQVHATTPSFLRACWGWNSDIHALTGWDVSQPPLTAPWLPAHCVCS